MIKDPLTEWRDGFPFDLLAGAGLGPESSMGAIRDASYTLMEQRQFTPQRRAAWDQLRSVNQRLVVEFFLYMQPLEALLGDADDRPNSDESRSAQDV